MHEYIKTKNDFIKHLKEQQDDHSGMILAIWSRYTLGQLIDMHNELHVSYVRMGQLARQIVISKHALQG